MESTVTVEMVLLCESVTIGPQGRPLYRHLVSEVVVPELPTTIDVLCYAAEVWGPPNQEISVAFAVVEPDGRAITRSPPRPLPAGPDGVRNFGGTLERLDLRQEGPHEFRIQHEGDVIGRARFVVTVDPDRARETFP